MPEKKDEPREAELMSRQAAAERDVAARARETAGVEGADPKGGEAPSAKQPGLPPQNPPTHERQVERKTPKEMGAKPEGGFPEDEK